MKHNRYRILAVVLAAVVMGAAVWFTQFRPNGPQAISGRVTNINNGCRVDDTCSVTLDSSKIIITGCGLTPQGKTCATFDQSTLHYGQQVEATVVKTGNGTYSLGCDTCAIRTNGR